MASREQVIDVPLGDRPYVTAYYSVGAEICQNLYLERSTTDKSKAAYFWVKIPGLSRVRAAQSMAPCRGMFSAANGKVFGVWGNQFVEVDAAGAWTVRGLLLTSANPVSFAENGAQVLVVDGMAGYIWDLVASTWERITEGSFPGNSSGTIAPTHAICIDTMFLVNQPGTNSYYWSNVGYQSTTATDPATGDKSYKAGVGSYWDGLTAGQGFKLGKPDQIMAIATCANQAWLVGSRSVEVHYNTGNYPETWARYEGAMFEYGCSARFSVTHWMTNVFWLGTDETGVVGVFTNDGYSPKRLSERGIEQRIEKMERYDDAVGFMLSQHGHTFYVLQFPTGDKTFVYDLATGTWTERTYLQASDGTIHAWRGMFSAYSASACRNLVGDRSSDAVFWSNPQAYSNDDETGDTWNYIQAVKTVPILYQMGALVCHNWLEIVAQQGVGLQLNTAAGVGAHPVVRLAFSNDNGVTWSSERMVAIGAQGEYQRRSRTPNLGAARNRVYRVSFTDPTPFILVGLVAGITVGNG